MSNNICDVCGRGPDRWLDGCERSALFACKYRLNRAHATALLNELGASAGGGTAVLNALGTGAGVTVGEDLNAIGLETADDLNAGLPAVETPVSQPWWKREGTIVAVKVVGWSITAATGLAAVLIAYLTYRRPT
jgi:hypothetical protein